MTTEIAHLMDSLGVTETQACVLHLLYNNFEGKHLHLSYAMSAVTLARRGLVTYSYDRQTGRDKTWFLTYEARATVGEAIRSA